MWDIFHCLRNVCLFLLFFSFFSSKKKTKSEEEEEDKDDSGDDEEKLKKARDWDEWKDSMCCTVTNLLCSLNEKIIPLELLEVQSFIGRSRWKI